MPADWKQEIPNLTQVHDEVCLDLCEMSGEVLLTATVERSGGELLTARGWWAIGDNYFTSAACEQMFGYTLWSAMARLGLLV